MDRRIFLTSGLTALAGATLAADSERPPPPLGIPLRQEPLAFDLTALEPYMDAAMLKKHYFEYHAKHAALLNRTVYDLELSVGDVVSLMPRLRHLRRPPVTRKSILQLSLANNQSPTGVQQPLPEEAQKIIRESGGAHVNHTAFWRFLCPPRQSSLGPEGKAAQAIEREFGTLNSFKEAFTEAAMNHHGHGWAWLVYREDARLVISTTRDEDNPLMKDFVDWQDHGRPILALDLWDHAYSTKHHRNRRQYIDAWWKVVNWRFVTQAHAIARGIYGHA